MRFDFTEEQIMVRDTARDFAVRELDPIAKQLDQEGTFPAEKIAMLAEMGFMGIAIPEEDGGGAVDVLNGIAYDAEGHRLFVTGKLWPKIFQIQLPASRP